MSKMTKRKYEQEKQSILNQIETCKNELATLDKRYIENYSDITEEIGDYWNGLHDKLYDLEKELKFLEDRWDRRNWTHSDYQQWDLITSNID